MPRTTSLKSIQAQILALEAKADALKSAEKPGIKQLRAVVSKFKLSPADVKLALNGRGRKRSALAGKKVAPKYRNPADKRETWTGRGASGQGQLEIFFWGCPRKRRFLGCV